MRFRQFALILLCTAVVCCGGCSDVKDTLLSGYEHAVSAFGSLSRTQNANLIGTRTDGTDDYTGAYAASCQCARGRDVVFGGCSTQTHHLKITGTVKTKTGIVRIFVRNGSEEEQYLTPDAEGNLQAEIINNGGDCYLLIDYADFTGIVTICSETTE